MAFFANNNPFRTLFLQIIIRFGHSFLQITILGANRTFVQQYFVWIVLLSCPVFCVWYFYPALFFVCSSFYSAISFECSIFYGCLFPGRNKAWKRGEKAVQGDSYREVLDFVKNNYV